MRFIILLCGLLACHHLSAQTNVIMIVVDDLNDWVGCMNGHPQSKTPNIDSLAERGILFANAHCAAPACNPSRAAVFSGRMPNVTGVWSNDRAQVIDKIYPPAEFLPTLFKKNGYRTLGTGKLLHSKGSHLFDDYYSVMQRCSPFTNKSQYDYTSRELPSKGSDNPRKVTSDSQGREIILPLNRMPSDRKPNAVAAESFDWGSWDVPDEDFGDTKITNWAIQKLNQRHDKPLFLSVGYYRPHIPLWAPKRFFERFKKEPGILPQVNENDLDDLSTVAKKWAIEPITAGSHETVLKFDQWRRAVEAYLACVTYVDNEIGRLMDAFSKSRYHENTIILLWSDHGWHLGEKQHWGKWTGWERSTKVPLIVVPPNNSSQAFKAGHHSHSPVSLIDIYPTLVEMCELKNAPKLDGKSLVPLLRDPNSGSSRGVVTFFDKGNISFRTKSWRLIQYVEGDVELYDMRNDLNEWDNLAGNPKFQSRLQRIQKEFQARYAEIVTGDEK